MDQRNPNVLERFATAGPASFEQELERRWNAITAIKNAATDEIVSQVEAETITPAEGLGIFSCLTGQLLGYQQFHGPATGADMVEALSGSLHIAREIPAATR